MSWLDFTATIHDDDADSVHAALLVDVVRNNMVQLANQGSPFSCAFRVASTTVSHISTAAAAYNNSTSVLWRSPLIRIRPRMGRVCRQLTVEVLAETTAGTGSLQAVFGPTIAVPASATPPSQWTYAQTSSTAVSTRDWHSMIIDLDGSEMVLSTLGAAADRQKMAYYAGHLTLRGKTTAGELRIYDITVTEENQ